MLTAQAKSKRRQAKHKYLVIEYSIEPSNKQTNKKSQKNNKENIKIFDEKRS